MTERLKRKYGVAPFREQDVKFWSFIKFEEKPEKKFAETRDYSELLRALRIWTRDLQIFSLTLSQLSYLGNSAIAEVTVRALKIELKLYQTYQACQIHL